MTARGERTLVLGIGNPLMGDDGAGVEVVRLLAESELPENVTVMEAGSPGWGLANWVTGWPSVILVDAAKMGREPGEWRRFDAGEARLLSADTALSLHESDLAGGLALAQALGVLPDRITIYGIEPGEMNQGLALSPVVRAALPNVAESIRNDIAMQAEKRENHGTETNSSCG